MKIYKHKLKTYDRCEIDYTFRREAVLHKLKTYNRLCINLKRINDVNSIIQNQIYYIENKVFIIVR